MASASWVERIRNLVKQPPFLIVQDLLNRIPGRPLGVARFFLLSLSDSPANTVRGFGAVRAGTPDDVAGMCQLENKKDIFTTRFKEGEYCVVAVHDTRIIGYEWFSDKAFHLEDRFRYRLEIPQDALYAYDGFIKREYRLRGIWALFQKYMLDQLQILGREKILTMVDFDNDNSLRTHLRFGYVKTRDVHHARFLNRRFFREKILLPVCFDLPKARIR